MSFDAQNILEHLDGKFDGDIAKDESTLKKYQHDTSMFEIKPQVVLFPKNTGDVKKVVRAVGENKAKNPQLSITARSAGTDMSGGAINDSIIMVFEKYFQRMGPFRGKKVWTEPGVHYKKFERETLKRKLIFPSYPASRSICAMGGIVSNNAGGEKSLIYGKTEDYVRAIRVVLSDGNEYEFRPLDKAELKTKLKLKGFEGELYRKVYKIVDENYEQIKKAPPKVSKNSTGYNLWNVWDRETGIFDMSALFVGAQGTLGLMTSAEIELVDHQPKSGMLVSFVPTMDQLPEIINTVVPFKPSSFEAFDEHTLTLSLKLFPQFRKTLGWKKFIKLMFSFVPDAWLLRKGLPKLIMMIEFEGQTQAEVSAKIDELSVQLNQYHLTHSKATTKISAEKYWLMRRESFNLLRRNVKHRHTAPFVDDIIVPPENLPEFWPKINAILKKYKLLYTIVGHIGDGNFHIIPLMDLSDEKERAKLEPCQQEVNDLVVSFGGSISAEHNDGLVRGPFLNKMYSPQIMRLFREVKDAFDPQNIFNPHKKTDATWKYSSAHIRRGFE